MDDILDVVKVIYLVCADMKKMVERLRRRALKENRFDDANDKVIQHRLEVYDRDTKPVLEHYPKDKIEMVDATMSQIRVLQAIMNVVVPIKSDLDHARETAERSGLMDKPVAVGAGVEHSRGVEHLTVGRVQGNRQPSC